MKTTRTIRVLLVDDNKNDALLLERAFQSEGSLEMVHHAPDAAQARRYLDASRDGLPDLILLDVNMPGENGFEVLEKLKQDPRLASIPVIMFTTSRRTEDIQRSYAAGAASFVTKPLTFEELCEQSRGLSAYWTNVAVLPRP